MNWQQNTVSVTMKERQNHRKRKNIKVHVFQTKDIIFLLSLSCFIFQLPSSYGFKGLMPFPEGKKKLWNSPLIYNWFSIKYIQLLRFFSTLPNIFNTWRTLCTYDFSFFNISIIKSKPFSPVLLYQHLNDSQLCITFNAKRKVKSKYCR